MILGFHFLALRVRAGGLPSGDEGSWIAVATELARGQGFSTRWLEMHFLLPYTLPRPDDYRYPVLTSLLALNFKVWGVSLETARWTVSSVFLVFASSAYLVCRSAFGRWAAMAGLWIMVSSLLQLEWNSTVYTEGMFGLVVAGLAAWCLWGERSKQKESAMGFRSLRWWAILGGGVGVLYLVRVNGILFLPGVAWLYWSERKTPLTWKHPAMAMAAFTLVTAPWLIRTGIHFGNPFHFAGSGGLLRDAGQSHTMNLAQYLTHHDVFFPLRRVVVGIAHFFRDLHQFEHALETVPLLLALSAAVLRRRFLNPFLVAGFLLSFAACSYASYSSWAGVRYMSGLLPFVYAYGLSLVPSLWTSKATLLVPGKMAAWMKAVGFTPVVFCALGIALLLLPVVHPHRFHERNYSQRIAASGGYTYLPDLAEHLSRLEHLLPTEGRYYAASLCNVNFLSQDKGCVGLQELYDPTWFSRSMAAFHPELLVLTHAEIRDSAMHAALARMRSEGYTQDTLETGALAVYLAVRPDSARAVRRP